jgi:hypothetical protein
MFRRPLLILALAVPLAACHKDAPTQTTPSNKTEPPAANATAQDVLGFLPADAEMVGGIDGVALRSGSLWQQHEPQILEGLGEKYARVRQECGFDPIKQVERITFGGKLVTGDKIEGVLVVRGVPGAKILDCLTKAKGTNDEVTNVGGVMTMIDRSEGMRITATVVADNTLVATIAPVESTMKLDAVIASGTPLRNSGMFMNLFNRREANAAIWGMINGNSPILAQAAQAGAQPKSIDGTLVISDKFDGNVRAMFGTPDEAANIQKQLEQVVQMIKGQLTTADVVATGDTVSMHVVASDQQIMTLMGMMRGFM